MRESRRSRSTSSSPTKRLRHEDDDEVAVLGTQSEEECAPLKEEDAVSEPSSSHSWRNLPSYVFKGYASSEADFTSENDDAPESDDDDGDDADESDRSI